MEKWRRRCLKTFGFWAMYLASLVAVAAGQAAVDARPFPRQFTFGGTAFTLYQPQLDRWQGTQLEGRSAMSIKTGTRAGADGKAIDALTTPPDSLKQVLAVGRCTYAPSHRTDRHRRRSAIRGNGGRAADLCHQHRHVRPSGP